MDLLTVGINHRTAPVALREKIAFTPDQLGQALPDLRESADLAEVAILSTCNRTEIYAINSSASAVKIVEWLARYHNLPVHALQNALYVHTGTAAIRHLLCVASGLDSMVLGEPQILGQVKDCFLEAKTNRMLGPQLDRLSQNTYRVAKRVRSTTSIGQNPVSLASVAVDLAAQLFSDIATCNVLLVGAGETIELVGRHLVQAGAGNITIANRTLQNAANLAEKLHGSAATLADIPALLVHTDILISSTASQLPILGKGTVERALKQRRHKPIFMVDLAVPRDIEPETAGLADVYLYSIDDLVQITTENMTSRQAAAKEAEAIIEQAILEIADADRSLESVDVLVKFRRKQERIKHTELARALLRLDKGEDPRVVLDAFANQLTNKLIHTPSLQLKKAGTEGRADIIEAINHLYDLPDEDDKET